MTTMSPLYTLNIAIYKKCSLLSTLRLVYTHALVYILWYSMISTVWLKYLPTFFNVKIAIYKKCLLLSTLRGAWYLC